MEFFVIEIVYNYYLSPMRLILIWISENTQNIIDKNNYIP